MQSFNKEKSHYRRPNSYYDTIIYGLQLDQAKHLQFFYQEFIPNHFPKEFTQQNMSHNKEMRVRIILYWLIIKNSFSCYHQGRMKWQCRLPSASDLISIMQNELSQMYGKYFNLISSLFIITKQDMKDGFGQFFHQQSPSDIRQYIKDKNNSWIQFYAEKQRQLIDKNLYENLTSKKKISMNKYINVYKISKILIRISSQHWQLPGGQYQIDFCQKQPKRLLLWTMTSFAKTMNKKRQPKNQQQKPQFLEKIWIGTCNQEEQSGPWNFYHSYQARKTIFITDESPYISIIVVVNEKLTIKMDIKFNNQNIREIRLLPGYHMLILLKKSPQIFAQYETNEMSIQLLSQFNKWYRVANFPLDFNQNLRQNRLKSHIFRKNMAILINYDRNKSNNIDQINNICFDNDILVNKIRSRQYIKHYGCENYSVQIGERLTTYIRNYKKEMLEVFKGLHVQQKDRIKQVQQLFIKSHFIQLDYSISIQNGVHSKTDEIIQELQKLYHMKQNPSKDCINGFVTDLYERLHINKAYLGLKLEPEVPRNEDLKVFKVYNIAQTPTGTVYRGYTNQFSCRVLRQFPASLFVKITFCDDDQKPIIAQTKTSDNKYIFQSIFKNYMDSLSLAGIKYIPLGWSNSQIKKSQMWYVIDHEIFNVKRNGYIYSLRDDIYSFLGNFQNVDSKKRPSRIGQSFSSSQGLSFSPLIDYSKELKQIQTPLMIDPVNKNIKRKYIFSDGIGQISKGLLERIKKELKLSKDVCSLQIRFLGYKGVVTLGNESQSEKYQVRMPNSMKKYECLDLRALNHFDILNWNKYSPGYINCQIIVLLLALKVNVKIILHKMEQFLNRQVYQLEFTEDTLINHFKTHLETSPINQDSLFDLINCLLQTKHEQLYKLVDDQAFFCELLGKVKRQLSLKIKNKLRFRIEKSARLMGILDFYDILEEGQVYCTIRKHQQRSLYNISKKAFITKNPCLHPSDIRIVDCVSDKQIKSRLKQKGIMLHSYQELVNVIVFPQKDTFPLSATISGGDLDGDYYLLCWDEDLIPKQHGKVHLYDDGIVKQKEKNKQKLEIKEVDSNIQLIEKQEKFNDKKSNEPSQKQQNKSVAKQEHRQQPTTQQNSEKPYFPEQEHRQQPKTQQNSEKPAYSKDQCPKFYHNYNFVEMFNFFLNYLQTTKIGLISYYHTLWAENFMGGAWSQPCLKLAKAHSFELDYSKKGVRPLDIQIPIPPKWMKKYSHKQPWERTSQLAKLFDKVCKKFNQNKKQQGLKVIYSKNLTWVFQIQKFSYTKSEIQSAMNIMQSYKNDIQQSLRSKNMIKSSEFVIYHGRDEDLITDSIMIRQKYKSIFFKNYQSQLEVYESNKIQSFFGEETPSFNYQILKKAFLWYIITNSKHLLGINQDNWDKWKYQSIAFEAATKIQKLKDNYLKLLKSGWFGVFYSNEQDGANQQNSEDEFQFEKGKKNQKKKREVHKIKVFENVIGLCWNVIPKVMIFLIRNVKSLR